MNSIFHLQKSIKQFMTDLNLFEDEDFLPKLIPESITFRHYVYFRIELKRYVGNASYCKVLIALIKCRLTTNCISSVDTVNVEWQEAVSNLWQNWLPNLRDQNSTVCKVKPISRGFGEAGADIGLKEEIEMCNTTNVHPLISFSDGNETGTKHLHLQLCITYMSSLFK